MTDLALRPTAAAVDDVKLSTHAWSRIKAMGVDLIEVLDTVADPEFEGPSRGARIAKKGRLAVPYAHERDRRVVLTVLWSGEQTGYEQWSRETEPEEAPAVEEILQVGSRMNGMLLDQLVLWGCNQGRRSSDYVHVRTPNGTVVRVRPAGHAKETSASTADRLYELLGVTAEQFWSRTTKVRPPRERIFAPRVAGQQQRKTLVEPVTQLFKPAPAPKAPARRGHAATSVAARVLAYFEQRPGASLSAEMVADELGIEVTQVSAACSILTKEDRLERIMRGYYQLAEELDDTERRIAEINRALASCDDMLRMSELVRERTDLLNGSSPTGVDPESSASVGAFGMFDDFDFEEEIDSLFELGFPTIAPDGAGDQFEEAVARWRSATRDLFEKVHA